MLTGLISRVLTGPFIITIARYALTAIGAWIVANYGFDASQWEVIAGAILTIVTAIWGGVDSVTNKVVVDGTRVPLSDMPNSAKAKVKEAVAQSINN